jgi:hypothetical protein
MFELNDKEKQELLDVVEYTNIQKEFWEIEKRFKEAQLKIISIRSDNLSKYLQLYNDNKKEIDNIIKNNLKEKNTDEQSMELSIEMLNILTPHQLEELAYRVMAEDFYGANFENIEILYNYIQNDLDEHNDRDRLNKYLSANGLSLFEDKVTGDPEKLMGYICDTYPPISKHPEVANTGLQLFNQVLGESK